MGSWTRLGEERKLWEAGLGKGEEDITASWTRLGEERKLWEAGLGKGEEDITGSWTRLGEEDVKDASLGYARRM